MKLKFRFANSLFLKATLVALSGVLAPLIGTPAHGQAPSWGDDPPLILALDGLIPEDLVPGLAGEAREEPYLAPALAAAWGYSKVVTRIPALDYTNADLGEM